MFRIDRKFVKLSDATRITALMEFNAKKSNEDEADAEIPDEEDYPEEETVLDDGDEPEPDDDRQTDDGESIAAEVNPEPDADLIQEKADDESEQEPPPLAHEVIENAEKEAARIIEDAQNEAEQIRNRAYDDGYAEGKRGAEHEYEKKLAEQRGNDSAELRAVLDEVAREREQIAGRVEEDATALAVEIVRKIWNPAEEELGNVYISLIKNAFKQISSEAKFIIRVPEDAYERLFAAGTAVIELDSGAKVTATVLKDSELEEGDLIIDAEDITVNAGLNTQLKHVQLAFEG